MATLTGNTIKDTYYKLVQVDDGQLVQNGIGSPLTGSIKLSGSLHVTGSQTVGGDLTVTGDVKARAFITELTQSTVLYKSGSTAFGDDATDTHSFSGSVTMHNSLALGNYSNVSASLDAAEDAIIANSASAATALTSLSASVDTHLDANISALSASTDSHLDSEIALLSASVDTHLDANITSLSSSKATALRAEYVAADTALSGAFDTTIDTLASTGSNTFSGLQDITGDLHLTGSFDKRTGDIISLQPSHAFGQTEVVQLDRRVQFRAEPTSSTVFRGHIGIVFAPDTDTTNVNMYGNKVMIGNLVQNGLYTEEIKLGTTASLLTISGSTVMTGSLSISGAIDSNEKANKIRFHYDTEGDLPSATDYHGMFAHVHATGLAYFAHGGNWVKLASSGSEASAIRAEYVAGDTALSSSTATALRSEYVAADTTLSSSAHTQRTALSASSAAVFETSASVASDYISIEKLKTFITGSYAEFQAAIGSL